MGKALNSVRFRTTFVATAAFADAFMLAAFALVQVVDARVHTSARRATTAALEGAAQAIQLTQGANPDKIQAALGTPVLWQVYDSQGNWVLGQPGPPLVQTTASGQRRYHLPSTEEYIVVQKRVPLSNGTFGTLMIASSLESANRGLAALRRGLLFATPALTILVALIVWWLV